MTKLSALQGYSEAWPKKRKCKGCDSTTKESDFIKGERPIDCCPDGIRTDKAYNEALNEASEVEVVIDVDQLTKTLYLIEIDKKDCDWPMVHSGKKIELFRIATALASQPERFIRLKKGTV